MITTILMVVMFSKEKKRRKEAELVALIYFSQSTYRGVLCKDSSPDDLYFYYDYLIRHKMNHGLFFASLSTAIQNIKGCDFYKNKEYHSLLEGYNMSLDDQYENIMNQMGKSKDHFLGKDDFGK